MNRSVLISIGALAGGLALVAAPTPAYADPTGAKNTEVIPLVCDNGVTYQVVVNSNGEFSPAHDLGSNAMLIPTSFGEFHGTLTDASGTVIDEFTDPPATKGSSTKDRRTTATCTFSFHETFEDPDIAPGVLTFDGEGSVTGFVTPAR